MLRTWRALIAEALVRSGWVGPGQTAGEDEFRVGKTKLEFVLDELDGAGLLLPAFSVLTFNTVSSQVKYLLGTDDLDVAGATAIRPTQIKDLMVNIGSTPEVLILVSEISFQEYQMLAIPSNTSQPTKYAVNWTWPQAELYLWPNPVQVYPMVLTGKITIADMIGDPDDNISAVAQVPQGYFNAIADIVALRIAEYARLQTDTLENRDREARFLMFSYISKQIKPMLPIGSGEFPWVRGFAGMNV